METNLSGPGLTMMLILAGFILAINLSLVFAFLHRDRDQHKPPSGRYFRRPPWKSRLDEPTEELSQRVASLRKQNDPDQDDTNLPSSS